MKHINKRWFLVMSIATFALLLYQLHAQEEPWQIGISAFLTLFWLYRYFKAPPPKDEQVAIVQYLAMVKTPRRALDISNATNLRLGRLYVVLHYLEKKHIVKRTEGDDPSLAFYSLTFGDDGTST